MLKIIFISILFCSYSFASQKATTHPLIPNYYFVDNSINYLNWTQKTEDLTPQKDFTYIELEAGAGWDWGEFYGFFDIENPLSTYNDLPSKDLRFVVKPIVDLYLYKALSLHIQNFHLESKTFITNNFVSGLSYKYNNDAGLWVIAFAGINYQDSTYYSGLNGYMTGWTFSYDFHLFGEKLNLFNWHEMEFGRATQSYKLSDGTLIGDGASYGFNGALSLWWKITTHITTGLQYRYAKYKLGSSEYQNGIITSLKYYY